MRNVIFLIIGLSLFSFACQSNNLLDNTPTDFIQPNNTVKFKVKDSSMRPLEGVFIDLSIPRPALDILEKQNAYDSLGTTDSNGECVVQINLQMRELVVYYADLEDYVSWGIAFYRCSNVYPDVVEIVLLRDNEVAHPASSLPFYWLDELGNISYAGYREGDMGTIFVNGQKLKQK